jgi:uncharacterized membrane protein YidH (DUF202 family)
LADNSFSVLSTDGDAIDMAQLWTLIFVTILATAFGLAAWYDREEAKRRARRNTDVEKRESAGD